jgi:hypothetical protein
VSIDTQLIVWITGFPSVGEDPLPLFTDKTQEKSLAERMKEKYGTFRGAHGLDVASINDDTVRFATQVLACKLLRKCHKDQVPAGVIAATEKCTAGVMMNWETFLGESIFNGLQGGTGERNKVPLCLVINFDSIGCLEGARRDAVPGGYAETILGSKVCVHCGIPHTRTDRWTTTSPSMSIRRQSDNALRIHHTFNHR